MSTHIGIDVGESAVKVAVVRSSYRKTELLGLASADVGPEGAEAAARDAIRRALGPEGGTGDAVAASIAGTRATVRAVEIPASAQKQLAEVLPFELEAQLPFDVESAVFDWRALPPREGVKAGTLELLVGVARTDDVRARIELVKAASGHEPERVGLGALPIGNVLAHAEPGTLEGTVAIVDVGTTTSDVLVLTRGEPIFARTISQGTRGLPGAAGKLARELRVSLGAHRAAGGEPPGRVLLAGGGAFVSGAVAFLANALELPVELVPAPRLELGGGAAAELTQFARYAKATGLALGLGPRALGLNLRRGPLAFERGFAWIKEKIPLLAGLGAVLVVSLLFSTWAQLHARSSERESLEAALSVVTKDVLGEETSSAERAKELLAQQTTITDEDPLPHADAFDVMVALSESIPESIVHDVDELDVQKGHVVVHGVVSTVDEAQTIKAELDKDRCVSDSKITRTNQVVGGDRQKYVLEFDLKCPEDQKAAAKKKDAAPAPSATGGDAEKGGK